jgi:hypothetical protein
MSAAAEVQAGAGVSFGIAGAVTMTGAATLNISNRSLTDAFKLDKLPSQNGAVIEGLYASQRQRDYDCEFVPKGATRAAAVAVVHTLLQLLPLDVITIGASTITDYNGTYNYMGGAYVKETREGYAVAGIKLSQWEVAGTGGTFAALAIVSG